MNTEYEFVNAGAALATQVFVGNDLAQQAVCNCDSSTASTARYSYLPWQFLNASDGAREFFVLGSGLTMVARLLSPAGNLAASAPMPVLADHLYLVFPGTDALCVTDLGPRDGSHDAGAAAVTAVALGLDPFALAIDWYLDDSCIGSCEPLGARQAARFRNAGTLLFRAVDPENPPARLSPQALADAATYQAASYVRKVRVTLRTTSAGLPVFEFAPPGG